MPVGIIFFGDQGSGDEGQMAVAKAVSAWCEAHRCDAVALLGDNFYDNGVQSTEDPLWQSMFVVPYSGFTQDFRPALGNHDYMGNPDAQVAYSSIDPRWKMPGRYYNYEVGNVELFVIDTEQFDRTQKKWLRRTLAKTDATWRIMYGHRPVHSYGKHGDNEAAVALRKALKPSFTNFDIDFYFAGHDHDMQVLAGHPLLVVAGTGGAKPRETGAGPDTLFSGSQLGFSYFSVEGDNGTIEMVAADGTVLYRHVVEK